MEPPARPPRLRCWLFPLIYPPHLLVLLATFGLHLFKQTYPYFPAFYAVPVRRTKGLPTASFRFHLTVNTLAVQLCASSLPTRTRDFHPLEPAHGGRTKNSGGPLCPPPSFPLHRLFLFTVFAPLSIKPHTSCHTPGRSARFRPPSCRTGSPGSSSSPGWVLHGWQNPKRRL